MVKVATTPPYTCSGHHRASNWGNLEISTKNQLFDPFLSLNFPFEWSERGKAQLNFPTWPLNYPTWSLNYPTWPLNFPTWTLNYPTWTFNYPTHSTLPLDHLTSPLDQLTCPLAHLTSPLDYTKPLLVQTNWFFKRNHSISAKKDPHVTFSNHHKFLSRSTGISKVGFAQPSKFGHLCYF